MAIRSVEQGLHSLKLVKFSNAVSFMLCPLISFILSLFQSILLGHLELEELNLSGNLLTKVEVSANPHILKI